MNQAFVLSNPVSESKTSVPQETFVQFIWRNKINRRYLLVAVVGMIVQFVIFKMLYPFPDFFSDSYSYIYAAYADLDVSIWPIGYSKFLRWFHLITHSDTALIAFQYLSLQLSMLYMFYTIIYFFNPLKTNRRILFAFLLFNPLFLYLCNYVNSDPLFATLSLLWFSQLIWVLHRPNIYQIFIQGILLFLCFTVRNNAYYYPIVATIAFSLSKQKLWIKLMAIIIPFLLIIPFIIHTRTAAYKMTGTKQFSLFTGWQLANNALYIFEYADSSVGLSPKGQELDKMVRNFYTYMADSTFHQYLDYYVGNYFIREPLSPLKSYMNNHYKITDGKSVIVAWGKVSADFSEYGSYIIKHNPSAYIHEFVLPNAKKYLRPPLEKLEIYNLGEDKVEPIAKSWFKYKTRNVYAVSKEIQGSILCIFPFMFLGLNIYYLATIISFWWKNRYKNVGTNISSTVLLLFSFMLLNFLFSIFVTVIVIRYEIVPMILCLSGSLLLTELNGKKMILPTINSQKELATI